MKKPFIFLFLLFVLGCLDSYSQDYSNKGKDFWLGYGYHVNMAGNPAGGGTQDMVLYFTSDKNATVTVDIPGVTGFTPVVYQVLANQVTTSAPLPKTGTTDARINVFGLSNKGIHITSDNPIVAYAHIYNSSISGASLLFPTATLGKDYYSVNFTQSSNAANANSFFFVVATEDGTSVEITPSAANLNGLTPNIPSVVTLNKGQIYNVMGTVNSSQDPNTKTYLGTDLSGSRIRSISTNSTGGCKKIAVFSGAGKMTIGSNPNGNLSADNLFAQAFPAVAWGKKYLTAPTGSQPNNYYRICVTDPNTKVSLNGVVLPKSSLINGFYYQFLNGNASGTNPATPNLIESDIPILVAQYCTTQGQDGNPNTSPFGDPEMIYLSPVEQTINSITLYSASQFKILQSYINIIIKNQGVASFKIDGVSKQSLFQTHPKESNYSYAIIPVTSGSHNLYSDSGFNAIAYGFGSAESYGYNAGTNVKDFTQTAAFQNHYKRLDSAISCVNEPFQFSIPLNFIPASIRWDFSAAPNINPNNNIPVNNAPVYDSVSPVNGQQLYYYSTGKTYLFTKSNTAAQRDSIKLYTTSLTPDGCGSTDQLYVIPVKVVDLPNANFITSNSGCVTDSVHFIDATNTDGNGVVQTGFWDYGDGTTDSAFNPIKKYLAAKTYNIRYRPITSYGCIGDTTISQTFTPPPVARFGFSDSCINSSIVFSDSSSIAIGNIVKWYWDFGDGTYDTTVTNAPRTKIYSSTGTYQVSLIVQSNSGCMGLKYTQSITIRPLPNTDFVLPTAVCLPIGTANFNDATSIASNNSISKWIWDFGDGAIDSTQNPTHQYSAVGNYSVKLRASSNYGCWKDSVKVLSNIFDQPKAKFDVTNFVCLRDTTVFTDSSNGMGGTIVKWNWNFGDGITDTVNNTKHVYKGAAVDTVTLFVITDKGCLSDTVKKTTIVNALPSAGFFTQAINNYCENKPIKIIDTATDHSITNASLIRWYWDMGNGHTYTITNGGYNTFFNEYYSSFKNYPIKMMVENSLGCKSDTLTKNINIHAQPHIGFVLPEVCLADASANFTDTSSIADGSTASSYLWNYNAGSPLISPGPSIATSTAQNGSTHYNLVGNYKVSFKITSSFGCDSTLIQPFTVNGSVPHANFIIQKNATLCSNDSIRIADSSYVDFGTVTKNEIYWNYLGPASSATLDDNPFMLKGYTTIYPNFSSPSSKTYQIRMTAHSGNSNVCANSITKIVTIHQSPQVQFSTIPGICNDTTARQIIQAKEIGSVPGNFTFTGTGINSSGLFTPNAVSPGTYPIKYVYTTAFTCADSAVKNITVWPSPIAKWGNSAILCEKNDIQFTDSSVANFSNIAQRFWSFGNGTDTIFNSTTNFNKRYLNANNYTVSLRVITDSGCRSSFNIQQLQVHNLPIPNFSLPSICLPDGKGSFTNMTTIADGSEALFSYLWNFGDPNDPSASTIKQPTHQYSALGPVNVQLKVTSKDQCIDSLTQSLTTIYPQPKANFSILSDTICSNVSLALLDISNGITSATNAWHWDFGNGISTNVKNPTTSFIDSGNYKVSLYVYNAQGCVSDTASKMIAVEPYPVLKLGPSKVVLENGQISLVPQFVYGRNLQYLWTPSDYLNSDTAATPISKPKADITYKLTLTGLGKCTVTDTLFIKVLFSPLVPNAFSPNGDGINDTWKIQYLESYPGATIDIFNRYGQKVFSSVGYNTEWDGNFNGSPLPVGTYYYIINPKNGRATMNGSVTIIK